MESEDLLRKGALQLGISLDQDKIDALMIYFAELKKWSRRINLIARDTGNEQIIENHFLDSLTLVPLFRSAGQGQRGLLDVGTGAGFPGLVVAIVLPDVHCTLVEPRKKRVSFLQHIVRTLKLTNVHIVADRVEVLDENEERFAYVTGRAVASPGAFLPMVYRFMQQGARAILMVAKRERLDEVADLEQPCQLDEIVEYRLPATKAPRILGVVALKPT